MWSQVGEVLMQGAEKFKYLLPHLLWCLLGERNRVSVRALGGYKDKGTLVQIHGVPDAEFEVAVDMTELDLGKTFFDAVVNR
jgi:hypothetical protein